ncbi:MAG: hypothetical protein HOQ22_14150 [Nocardioidaceae bacterium]|nr:hypothetical protein [Nocardioidaceae bacterium]NUS52167.1 hypothetical protein [Nocardioidaceae bacterium]
MQLLTRHAGTWVGTNRFRLMPDDAPAEADATARLTVGAGGNVATLAYTWAHAVDGPQDGLLMVGPGDVPGEVLALWGDSWHQKPAAAQLRGSAGDDTLTVGFSYAEGWEWRITLTADEPDVLRWRMDNVVPPSPSRGPEPVTYWAMDADLRRAD